MSQDSLAPLSRLLAKLPGLGPRSARRALIHLLENKDDVMAPLASELKEALETIQSCEVCGNLDKSSLCHVCVHPGRDQRVVCVVEGVADLWALERNVVFKGVFHVLGGTLSAIDGVGPDDLRISGLIERVQGGHIDEVILALSATIDGQTTTHYVVNELKPFDVKVTAIAHGIPVGGELDYLDEGTLSTALQSRRDVG